MWKNLWILTIPAMPARPSASIIQPKITVNDLINGKSKEWDVGLLENYVPHEYIPLTRILAIIPIYRPNTFCLNYTKSGQYTVKSGY